VSILKAPLLKPLRPYQARILQCLQRLYLRRQAAAKPLFCTRPPVVIRPAGVSASTAPFPPTPEGCFVALGGEEGLALGAGGSSPGAALLYLPTGGGKTRVAGELAKWVLCCGGAVLFVVNRTVLVAQAAAALRELGVGAGDMCVWGSGDAGCGGEGARLHVATVQALAARQRAAAAAAAAPTAEGGAAVAPPWALPRFDLLLLDEAHGAVSPSYAPLWAAARSCAAASCGGVPWPTQAPSAPTPPPRHTHPFAVGLTATPVRLGDAESLGLHFDVLVNGPSLSALVGAGVLVPPLVFEGHAEALAKALKGGGGGGGGGAGGGGARPGGGGGSHLLRAAARAAAAAAAADVSGSDEEGGEEAEAAAARHFAAAQADVDAALQRDDTLDAVVALWGAKCGGGGGAPPRTTLVFAPSVAASLSVVAAFSRAGIAAAHVDGGTPPTARAAAFASLAQGATTLLSSVGVLSEGFDEPRVSAVVLLRPTASRGLYVQQVGRGLRTCPGAAPPKTNCVVLDFVGATFRHGPVTRPLLALGGEGGGAAGAGAGVSAGEGIPPAVEIDEATAAAAAVAARRAAGAGAAAAEARVREAARQRAEAVKGGLRRAWVCAGRGCRAINHIALARCAACGAPALAHAVPVHPKQQTLPRVHAQAPRATAPAALAPPPPQQQQQQQQPAQKAPAKVQTTLSSLLIPKKAPASAAGAPTFAPAQAAARAPQGEAAAALAGAFAALALCENAPPPQTAKAATCGAAPPAPLPPTPASGSGGGPRHGGTDATFAQPAFAAACRALSLPPFSLACARTPWERAFLLSVAAQITPGVPHEWKRAPEDTKPLTGNQRDVLSRLALRAK
jgi:superfamily II DNA or RNA helicase